MPWSELKNLLIVEDVLSAPGGKINIRDTSEAGRPAHTSVIYMCGIGQCFAAG